MERTTQHDGKERSQKLWIFDNISGEHVCTFPKGQTLTINLWDVIKKEEWDKLSVGMQTIAIYGSKQIPADRNPSGSLRMNMNNR